MSVAKIAALLRQAEGTDNEHEAEAFMQRAQQLATMYSVDLAVARAHTAAKERRTTPMMRSIEIGQAGKRGLRTYVLLFVHIARANDVTCDVASNSTRVFAYGYAEDIDAAEALYASLAVQMIGASDAYLARRDFAGEVRLIRNARGRVERRAVSAITARLSFQEAFAHRVGERLAAAREDALATINAQQATAATESLYTALVLAEKQEQIAAYHAATSEARGSWGAGRAQTMQSRSGRAAGDSAGKRARLHGGAEISGGRGALRR
ncbi:MAG: DUF2786 domain-containing protein [Antricoccus sp.]